jgi:hypothetical protein
MRANHIKELIRKGKGRISLKAIRIAERMAKTFTRINNTFISGRLMKW